MVRARFLLLFVLVGCHRPPAAVPQIDRFARLRMRATEMISQARLLADSDRFHQIPWVLEIGMDDLLLMTLNQYECPPLRELGDLLKNLDSPYSPVRLTGWISVPGSRDFILGYSISPACWEGSARLRAAHWEKGRYALITPYKESVQKAEEELACWRGADLYARYGPPYHPDEIRMADCWGPENLVAEDTSRGNFLFRASYGIGSTCPGEFEIVWNYSGGYLRPEQYSWGNYPRGTWRRFYATPVAKLAKLCSKVYSYEGK